MQAWKQFLSAAGGLTANVTDQKCSEKMAEHF